MMHLRWTQALETERKNREAALNTLEGMIYKNKDFLYNEETEAVTNETQRDDMSVRQHRHSVT